MPILIYAASVAKPSARKNTVIAHLSELEPMPCRGRVGTCETAPFHREAIEADAAVQLDRQQQQDIERPQVLAPDPVGGLVRSDAVGTGEHDVQMHRRQEEQREAREYLPEPQRGVFVFHHPHVTAKRPELVVVARGTCAAPAPHARR